MVQQLLHWRRLWSMQLRPISQSSQVSMTHYVGKVDPIAWAMTGALNLKQIWLSIFWTETFFQMVHTKVSGREKIRKWVARRRAVSFSTTTGSVVGGRSWNVRCHQAYGSMILTQGCVCKVGKRLNPQVISESYRCFCILSSWLFTWTKIWGGSIIPQWHQIADEMNDLWSTSQLPVIFGWGGGKRMMEE